MAVRKKKVVVTPPLNEKEANEVMAAYAVADARTQEINSLIEQQITKIREKHTVELAELGQVTETSFSKMQMYAESNPKLFKLKKSLESPHGTIGFRTSKPALKAKQGFTWAAVLELLKGEGKKGKEYIRTKEEVAKDLLLAGREDKKCKKLMDKIQVRVLQEDSFYIELKKEA